MRLTASCFTGIAMLASLSLAACSGSQTTGATSGSPAGSSAGSVAATSAGSTTGPGTSSSSGTTSGGSGSSTTGGSSTGTVSSTGTTTGAPLVFVDGGYVSCMLASAVDAGPDGDGGPAYWNCPGGTYFCDPSGDIGNCFQCQSDTDCANPNLPTFDPRRPHCDTSSGVLGAEHFCQECITNSDCVGNPNGGYCDVNLAFLQPSIETLGFETCNPLVTDCRVDGGPVCGGINQYCDLPTGHCLTKTGACQSDDDCVGYLSPYNASVPEPYCSDAGCSQCQGGVCPNGYCTSDAECGNGTICDLAPPLPSYTCKCTDSSQCGGLWPTCLDPQANDAGQILGTCGCDDSSECGDGGMACLPSAIAGGIASCGIPCTSPEFPSCFAITNYTPVCNPQSGSCGACTNDNQCRNSKNPAGPRCDSPSLGGYGTCGCAKDSDCAPGESCQSSGGLYGTCTAALPHCTPASCASGFCNWDSGSCVSSGATTPLCLTDFDCAIDSYSGSTCVSGTCIQCQSSADCLNSGAAATGGSVCCLPGVAACEGSAFANNTCADTCAVDADCTGNYYGGSCIISDAGYARCGCGSDSDCATYPFGHHCDRDPSTAFFGYCSCATNADCSEGEACQIYSGYSTGYCGNFCTSLDAGACAPGYTCDPSSTCRARCDDGNQCQGTESVCDSQNAAGQNDAVFADPDAAGVTWCYSCASPSDCPAGEGCDPKHGCGTCSSNANCPAGTACVDGGLCQPTCSDGACPAGEVCDVHGLAGFGPNICYQCLSAKDCPNSEGCNSQTHTCGTCYGPNATINVASDPGDCPPDAVCSNYWTYGKNLAAGVCLANCDRTPCPSTEPICAVYPGLTPDHKYCFGCLKDSDCGPNQRCNLSPDPTFTCVDKP